MVTDYENKISLEDWADEILKRRDSFDNEHVFETTDFSLALESTRNTFFKELKATEKDYSNHNKSNPQILADLITHVSKYLIDTAQYNSDRKALIHALHFYKLSKNVFLETHEKTYKSFSLGENIALFILALKLNGSSVLQAKKSVSKWTGMSQTKVESYYTKLQNKESKEWDNVCWLDCYELASVLLSFKDKDFPSSNVTNSPIKKTFDAYLKVKNDIIEHFKDPEFFSMMPIRTLQLGIDWNEYDQFRQKVIALD